MPTFEFADCPTRLDLSKPAASGEQVGTVTCSVRNTLANRQAGRIKVEPDAGAKPEWFAITGGLATSPLELEQDFAPGSAVSVTVQVRVPAGAAAGPKTFKLRVTSEQKPDTDFAIGPAIGFDVAAPAAPPVKPRVPIWAYGVIALVVLAIGIAVAVMVWPKGKLDPNLVAGRSLADARQIAEAEGYGAVGNRPADEALGYEPGIVSGVDVDSAGNTVLLTDPGVTIPTGLRGQSGVTVAVLLGNIGLLVTSGVARDPALASNLVARVAPPEGSVVKLGETVRVDVNDKPGLNPGGVVVPLCKLRPDLCPAILNPQFERLIEESTMNTQRILK